MNPPELPKGSQPWDLEPSFLKWRELTTGLKCIMLRNPTTKTLCGYVRVMRDHPLYGIRYMPRIRKAKCAGCGGFHFEVMYCSKDRSTVPLSNLLVHGGVTFAGKGNSSNIYHGIHFEGRYWIGFDTGHSTDICPGIEEQLEAHGFPMPRFPGAQYRDWDYVKAQTEKLAQQLGKMLT